MPMCAWADDDTGASVGIFTDETAKQDPKDVDLETLARTTLHIRKGMRQPIG
ncbi:hypothetical protein ACIBKX_36995 [Streptomyces sp. NPDC050658]|uniref:hypothetical protein n=1 Tax=unclassified Streptomyces TaxID=2593676 RepID=UPI003422BC58